MKQVIKKNLIRDRRKKRTRAPLAINITKPRASIFRSGQHTYVQILDPLKGVTIVSGSTRGTKAKTKIEAAEMLGAEIAKKAKEKGITEIVFDRGAYKYHGRVKSIAESLRKNGLKV